MIYILLAIVCSSTISITMKVCERYGQTGYAILCMNYIFATAFSLIPALRCGNFPMVTPAVWILGIITGVLFLVTFIIDQYSICTNGAVLTATFMKMGILVPVLLAQVLWHEKASLIQTIGIVIAIAAILVMTIPGGKKQKNVHQVLWILPVLLLCAGASDSMSKFYIVYGVEEVNEWYMVLTFLTALIVCFPMMIRNKEHFNKKKVGLGAILGLMNYASTWFLLLAVAELPSYIVYPMVNVGVIALIAVVCMTAFGERLKKHQIAGLGMVLIAIVLLNL